MNWTLFLGNMKFYSCQVFDLFDIRGGAIVGLFSFLMLAVIPWCLLSDVPFPATVRDVYLGVIAAFAGTNVAKHYAASKNGGANEPQK